MSKHGTGMLKGTGVVKPRAARLACCSTHLGRVTQPVKPDEGAAPVHIGLFGAQAVMQGADALPQLIEQPRRFQRRQCLTAPWRPARRRMGFMHLVLSLGAPFRGGGCQRPRAQVKCVVRTLRQFA